MGYDWKDAGEEWSAPWGTSAAQWSGAILPRIQNFLSTATILEIGAGFGRWTNYLRDHCNELIAVDRVDKCVAACRSRFEGDLRVRCFVNDGRSLPMVPDDSIDLVFSFDSLVHAKPEIVEAYLAELGTKLKRGGAGFIHHSNFGEYADSFREQLPKILTKLPIKMNLLDWDHHRDRTMTAKLFRDLCRKHGLACESQELVNWRGRRLIDCFSVIRRNGSLAGPPRLVRNRDFMAEAAKIRARSRVTQSAER